MAKKKEPIHIDVSKLNLDSNNKLLWTGGKGKPLVKILIEKHGESKGLELYNDLLSENHTKGEDFNVNIDHLLND